MIKGRPDPPLTSTSFVPAILAVVSVQFANGVSSLLGLICKCTSFDITCAAGSESVRHGEGEQPVSRASDAKRNTLAENTGESRHGSAAPLGFIHRRILHDQAGVK